MATSEQSYLLLGQLISEMPPLCDQSVPIDNEINRWLGRAIIISEPFLSRVDVINLKFMTQNLSGILRQGNAQTISVLLFQALAAAELKVSQPLQGTFLPANSAYDAFIQVGKIIASATNNVLLVDPYADEKILDEFARPAAENITIRVLADKEHVKSTLEIAANRWLTQFGPSRPLEVKISAPKTLHDRFIIIDDKVAWLIGQSFNGLATRSPTAITRMQSEPGDLAITAMATFWATATSLP